MITVRYLLSGGPVSPDVLPAALRSLPVGVTIVRAGVVAYEVTKT